MCQVVPVENLSVVPGAWETLTEVTKPSLGSFRKRALGCMAIRVTTREQTQSLLVPTIWRAAVTSYRLMARSGICSLKIRKQ